MNRSLRPIRAILGLAVLSIVFFMVFAWILDYRGGGSAVSDVPGVETTATVTPEGEDATGESTPSTEAAPEGASPSIIVVLIDGLNFRKEPSGGADRIGGLDEGEKLELISTENGWHKVKDSDGTVGYVSASTQYTRVQQ